MKKISKPIVFFGNEKLATGIKNFEPVIFNALKSAGYEIEQHILGDVNQLKPTKAKLAVLVAYGRIIPKNILDKFELGIINVHPSLLPLHRGPTPIESVIINGDTKTGVSIIRLTEQMDAGPILGFSEVNILANDTKIDLSAKLSELGASMLVELLPLIFNDDLDALAQDESTATYDKLITKSDGKIDWNKPAEQIEREVRAYLGWPGSYTRLGNIELIVTSAELANNILEPGEILVNSNELVIGCSENSLKILSLKPIGKKQMPTKDFLLGYKSRITG